MKRVRARRWLVALLSLALLVGLTPVAAYADPPPDGIAIADQSGAAPIYIDSASADYDGIFLAAQAVAEDIRMVTGEKPDVVTAAPSADVAIIAGTLDDSLIQGLGLTWTIGTNDWERYQIQVIDDPAGLSGIDKAVVIAGSDKRGTIYGLYHISQDLGGVSPWVYWADVVPVHRDSLIFSESDLETVSKEPSVKYRGIFLNDEAPSLSSFVANTFGEFNYQFYDTVFELVLRLKGNYMWPAMWNNAFSEDGVLGLDNPPLGEDKYANIRHADAYGVVMGASHHEQMARAGVEFGRLQVAGNPYYSKPTVNGSSQRNWDYINNKDNIYDFWSDGIARNKPYENIITVGMRGENDSALGNFTLAQNIDLLKNIITDQNKILDDADYEPVKMLALYKEVEPFWYGDAQTPGLNEFPLLDDTIITLCEDNNGQLRTLPGPDEMDRPGGWGMYYHFDFHGGPTSYEWIACHPMQRVWDNMTMAYDYGIRDLWIVNVGDLKPMELPISYFLDMAYDFDQWGSSNRNSAQSYIEGWVQQQFGTVLNAQERAEVAQMFTDYLNMNTNRRPEMVKVDTFNTTNYNEAQAELAKAFALEAQAEKYLQKFEGTAWEDAFWQLIYYQAASVSNIRQMYIFAGLASRYSAMGSIAANAYADLSATAVQRDKDLTAYYNNTMSGGYWKGMMSSPHVGYTTWDSTGWSYPTAARVTTKATSAMIVDVDGNATGYKTGAATLPDFTSVGKEAFALNVSNEGTQRLDYTLSRSADWILIDGQDANSVGSLYTIKKFVISVDWSKVSADASGTITVTAGDRTVTVNVNAKVLDTQTLENGVAVMQRGIVSVGAERYTSKGTSAAGDANWEELENYGKFVSTMKTFPTTKFFASENIDGTNHGPYLEYKVYVPSAGTYRIRSYFGPSNPPYKFSNNNLRYAIQINGGSIVVEDSIDSNYSGGDYSPGTWQTDIGNNGRYRDQTGIALNAGVNTIRFYGVDGGVLFQKFVVSQTAPSASYYGPQPTYIVGDPSLQKDVVSYDLEDVKILTIPGKFSGTDYVGSVSAGDLDAQPGQVYTYQTKVETKGTFVFSIEGSSATGAKATLRANGDIIGELTLSPQMAVKKSYEFASLDAGTANIEMTVSAAADIRSIISEKVNPSDGYLLIVKGSSNDANAKLAADRKRATVWTPEPGDANPTLTFDYGEDAVYADSFKAIGDFSGVSSYVVETSDDGEVWTPVFTGQALAEGTVYMQGREALAAKQWRVKFTGSNISVSEFAFSTYINWALADEETAATVSKSSDNPSVIIDGDRIGDGYNGSGAWVASQANGQNATLTFGEARTLTGVNLLGLQVEVNEEEGPGAIPDDSIRSSLVPMKYTVEYWDGAAWAEAAVYETGASPRKVLTHIDFDAPIETTAIRVVIQTTSWIRLVEFEPVEALVFSIDGLEKGVKNWALQSEGGTVTRQDAGGNNFTTDTGYPAKSLGLLNDGVTAAGSTGSSQYAPAGAQACSFMFYGAGAAPVYLTVGLQQPIELKKIVSITQQPTATPSDPTPDMTGTTDHTPVTMQYWNGLEWIDAVTLAQDAVGNIKTMHSWSAPEGVVTDKVRFVYTNPGARPGGFAYYIVLAELQVLGKAFDAPVTDKSLLEALYNTAKPVLDAEQGDYTDGSWDAFEDAMETARTALGSFTADQDAIDEAYELLSDAYLKLRTNDELALALLKLQIAIAQAENIDDGSVYTTESWADLQAALEVAQEMYLDPDSYTLEELDAGAAALVDAMDALEFAVDKGNLQLAVDIAEEMLLPANVGKYIPVAVTNLNAELLLAIAVLEDADATQAEVDAATDALSLAIFQMHEKADKSKLQALYNTVLSYDVNRYTPSSWSDFAAALEKAEDLLGNDNATKTEVEEAYTALLSAVTGLKLRANFTALETAIQQAQAILTNADDYVPASIEGLQAQLTSALAVFENKDSTQAQINTARSALMAKVLNARLKADKSSILGALGVVQGLSLELYTADSVQALNALVVQAKALAAAPDAQVAQIDVDALAASILEAIGKLVLAEKAPVNAGPGASQITGAPQEIAAAAANASAGELNALAGSAASGTETLAAADPALISDGNAPLATSNSANASSDLLPWMIAALLALVILSYLGAGIVRRAKSQGKEQGE